jgi:hypothetical protein
MDVSLTTNLSIVIQFLTGIIAFLGLFISVLPEDAILIQILQLEMFIEVVEFSFYIFVLRHLATKPENMAPIRYFDWVITTPIMLFITIVYFKYEEYKQNKQQVSSLTLSEFIKTNTNTVIIILLSNLMMLVFGYLGEIGIISLQSAAIFGFIFFIISFYTIYQESARHSKIGQNMYYVLLFIWSLYGISYLLPTIPKNNIFNILDIFAKNFFGVFLYFKIKSVGI